MPIKTLDSEEQPINFASSTECSLRTDFSDSKNPRCGSCGSLMELASDDPQQGKVWHCTGCVASHQILPLNPPCGCNCQPCEHTTWDIPPHPGLQVDGRSWFQRLKDNFYNILGAILA